MTNNKTILFIALLVALFIANVSSQTASVSASVTRSVAVSSTNSSVSASVAPSNASVTATGTPSNVSVTITPSVNVSVTVRPSGPSPSRSPPNASPSPFSAPSIIFFTSILCNINSTDCCTFFAEDWASIVSSNNASLITVLSCAPDGILTNVVFIQNGAKTGNSTALSIAQAYFALGGCDNTTSKCYPTYGSLNTGDWDLVLNLFVEGGINIGDMMVFGLNNNRTAAATSHRYYFDDDDDNRTNSSVSTNSTTSTNSTRNVFARLVQSNSAGHLEVMACVLLLIWTLVFL